MENTLDCDTHNCPQYNRNHGCNIKTVQLRNGVCLTYLSEMRYKRIGELIEGIQSLIRSLPPAQGSEEPGDLEKTTG